MAEVVGYHRVVLSVEAGVLVGGIGKEE